MSAFGGGPIIEFFMAYSNQGDNAIQVFGLSDGSDYSDKLIAKALIFVSEIKVGIAKSDIVPCGT